MSVVRGSTVCAFVAGVVTMMVGCSFEAVDPTGKPCPCPDDLVCDEVSRTCVQSLSGTSSGGCLCSEGCGTCPSSGVVPIDGYDIDAREVTAGNYQAFLDAKPPLDKQLPKCTPWNDSFQPSNEGSCTDVFQPITYRDRPAVCVDWCDAVAYCAWMGRRLCGQIGGGILAYESADDPLESEWTRACSKDGTLEYPYGNEFGPSTCNTTEFGTGALADVGSIEGCTGGYLGLFDMSGNAGEWEDSCSEGDDPNDPQDDGCRVRGGAFWAEESDSRCRSLAWAPPRNSPEHSTGIRCCATLP